MTLLLLFAPLVTLGVGAVVVWNNPRRLINQIFGLASLTATLWLAFVILAQLAGSVTEPVFNLGPVPWIRAASAVGAFFPWLIWLLKESIMATETEASSIFRRSTPWFAIGLALAVLCFSESFVVRESTPGTPLRGLAYLVYSASSFFLFLILAAQTYRQMRRQTGIRRLEMQFLTLNAVIACLAAIALNAAGNFLQIRTLARLTPLLILVFYALTAWSITFHRVFDARHVFLSITQRVGIIGGLCAGIVIIYGALTTVVGAPFDLIIAVALCAPVLLWLDRASRDWLGLSPAQELASMRRAVTDLARSQPSPDKLVADLEQLLRDKCHTPVAAILFDSADSYSSAQLTLSKNRSGHAALCREGWATPESLQRQRPIPGLVDLRQILTEHDLGLIVTAPPAASNPSLIVALGIKANHRPFTYPEVQRLQEVAEFMDNTLARSRLTLQARQSEQLAVIGLLGASLAHEIRNPLVSIKTFAHLLPSRFDDEEFRRKFSQLVPVEVDRIDALTQQLLDLAHPRPHNFEHVTLHSIVSDTIDLIHSNAAKAEVEIVPKLVASPDTIRADSSSIRQVIINLLINAIQALETTTTPRQVEIRTRNHSLTGVILEVSDNGPGIPPDHRPRLFQPFASTKTKGMGLGLAVCADILRGHGATIIVPDNGRAGATFRITFPCPPPLS